MTKRRSPSESFTDDQLRAFVLWCRLNDQRIVELPNLVRDVMDAYAGSYKGRARPLPIDKEAITT